MNFIHRKGTRRLSGTDRARRILAAVMLTLPLVSAADFSVVSGHTSIVTDAIVTEAQLDSALSDAVVDAIDKGIEIRIVAELRLIRVRPRIWDEVIGEWRTGFRLKYHDLSSTYVLVDERTGELEPFSTIRDAMDSLAELTITLPVVTETLPQTRHGYRASLRIDIDRDELPPPLKLVTEISPEWKLGSRWTEWAVAE
ncbi:MAG: DUF4390 domain-containing protein [Gammaproteobacteria bacterium]|nr:DUF4390 domain-containing protein [Gammaproteobacteria bacterium]